MSGFFDHLAVAHDPWLLLLAVVIGFVVSVLCCTLFHRAFLSDDSARFLWLSGAAISAGTGYWGAHVTALLGFRTGHVFGFDPVLTLTAWVVAVVGMGASVALLTTWSRWWTRLFGALALAGTEIAIHYVALAAYLTRGVLHYSPEYVAASIFVPVVIIALSGIFTPNLSTWRARVLTSVFLTVAVIALHLIGTTAVTVAVDAHRALPDNAISPAGLEVGVVGLLGIALSMGVISLLINSRDDASALGRLRSVVEAMPAGLAYYDADDRAVVWNRRYAEQGGPCGDLLTPGVSFRSLMKAGVAMGLYAEAAGREAEWVEERLALRRTARGVFEQRDGDRWLRIEENRTEDGGLVSVTTDITDLKRNAESLAHALQLAETANRAKDEFLANMSHELRTPLNGVIGLASALANMKLAPAQLEIATTIQTSAQSLERLLSDVLEFSSLEAGTTELGFEHLDLDRIVQQTVSLFRTAADAKGIALAGSSYVALGASPAGDATRIKRIICNLLSNAIKFTHVGGVALTVETLLDEDGCCRLEIKVSDTGVGFDAGKLETLFGRFEQADGSSTRQYGGMGLGLSLSRSLARLMGGDITAQSAPGQGAVFSVQLPLAQADATPADQTSNAGESTSEVEALEPSPLRVLLADDHPTNRKVVQLILSSVAADVTSVEDGAQAVDAFEHAAFDVVLMDLQMPVMDGLSAMRRIRAHEQANALPRTPMIALTANVLPEHVDASLVAGATSHMGKPITASVLLIGIDTAISNELEATEQRLAG